MIDDRLVFWAARRKVQNRLRWAVRGAGLLDSREPDVVDPDFLHIKGWPWDDQLRLSLARLNSILLSALWIAEDDLGRPIDRFPIPRNL